MILELRPLVVDKLNQSTLPNCTISCPYETQGNSEMCRTGNELISIGLIIFLSYYNIFFFSLI